LANNQLELPPLRNAKYFRLSWKLTYALYGILHNNKQLVERIISLFFKEKDDKKVSPSVKKMTDNDFRQSRPRAQSLKLLEGH